MIAWTLSIAVVAIVGAAGVNAATKQPAAQPSPRSARNQGASRAAAQRDSAPLVVATTSVQLQGGPTALPTTASTPATDSAAHATASVASPTVAARIDSISSPSTVIGPIIPQGRTDLPDSVYAVRRGDTVMVNFDTGPARTRRADKFELIVRQTLHSVYGPVADTLLTAVPTGKLVLTSELVTTLPKHGLHLKGTHGPRVALWPRTRPGRDGLLVYAYRTVVER